MLEKLIFVFGFFSVLGLMYALNLGIEKIRLFIDEKRTRNLKTPQSF